MTSHTGDQTDGELLEYFADSQDEEAFAELVRRHGPLVLGVCRRMLRHEQDAEDTFQATFLVLARKASSLRSAAALSSWLFGVASRLAARTRTIVSRRRAREVPLVDSSIKPAPDPETGDLGRILHEEIGRLPEKYRQPFVLCYLDGKTNEEAAEQLGCPPGTVYSRLARARQRLRSRLARRGLVLSAGLLAGILEALPQEAWAAVPPGLVTTTAHAATLFVSGQGGGVPNLPARVANLARWGLQSHSSRWPRMLVLAALLLGSLGVLVVGLLLWWPRPEKPISARVQGKWTLQSLSANGALMPGARAQLTLEGDRIVMMDDGWNLSGTYRLDTTKSPMQIDWTAGPGRMQGIFQLEEDVLTICTQQGAAGPPADFTPGPGRTVMIFVRPPP